MRVNLLEKPEVIKDKFYQLKTLQDVADILEVDHKTLVYLLYRKNKPPNYKEFVIKKRSGSERKILAPISTLKILQRKLNYILSICYQPRPSVQGFVKDRNIVTNAAVHSGKKVVLNLDLKDFFPSINFGRVRGLFMKAPFGLTPSVATALANICCSNNQLPQGAPTSPIISNLICSRMDGQFQALAKKYNAVYTRYADDITFSTRELFFHKEILETGNVPLLGKGISSIVSSNGFIINDSKTRVLRTGKRQEVTGLVTNNSPNIKRQYVRDVRVLLDKWKKYGLEVAKEKYFENRVKERAPHIKSVDFSRIIEGKINFVKMVKGQKNRVYRNLINKFNDVSRSGYPLLPLDDYKIINESVWMVESNGKPNGTAFMLEGVGLVTCAHVFDLNEKIIVYKLNGSPEKYRASVKSKIALLDLAILEPEDVGGKIFPSVKIAGQDVLVGEKVLAVGYPQYFPSSEPQQYPASVSSLTDIGLRPYIVIDRPLYVGMSGGVLLNSKDEAIGVLARGASDAESSKGVIGFSAIPIKFIKELPNYAE